MSMVRSEEWKIVHFMGESFGQLFNLRADPGETENRWDDPDCQQIKNALLQTLLNWRMESQYQTCNWAAQWR